MPLRSGPFSVQQAFIAPRRTAMSAVSPNAHYCGRASGVRIGMLGTSAPSMNERSLRARDL